MPSNFSDDERLDAEMLAEEMTGKIESKTPEEGIADMEKRIKLLGARRDRWHEHADQALAISSIIEIERAIADAQARLKEYQAQLKGRN